MKEPNGRTHVHLRSFGGHGLTARKNAAESFYAMNAGGYIWIGSDHGPCILHIGGKATLTALARLFADAAEEAP